MTINFDKTITGTALFKNYDAQFVSKGSYNLTRELDEVTEQINQFKLSNYMDLILERGDENSAPLELL